MANELKVNVSLTFTKGSTTIELVPGVVSRDVAGTRGLKNRQTIGTSEEAVLVGDVGAGGYILAVNRDATNFIELRAGAGLADLVRLEPGDVCMFRITDDATLYAIADTAACELEYAIIEA